MKRAEIIFVTLVLVLHIFTFRTYSETTQVRRFAEVRITLDKQFTLADAEALSVAPESKVEALEDGKAVKTQISAENLAVLARQGVDFEVLRNFLLLSALQSRDNIENSINLDSDKTSLASCSGAYEYGESPLDVDLPGWSGLDFSTLPYRAVSCIDVHYEIFGTGGFIYVYLDDDEEGDEYELEDDIFEEYVSETQYGITYFNGEPLNQIWWLGAEEVYGTGIGYIDFWWIKLYYEGQGGYCSASGGECYEYISRVQVGSIDNPSGCDGYADYTGLSTEMSIGTGYSITVSNEASSYPEDECGIWVDWNQDEDFDDADETITVSGSPGVSPYAATITPPAGAALGQTRMRVRIVWDQAPSSCGNTDYGEVEDYTITVSEALPSTVFIRGHVTTNNGYNLADVNIAAESSYNTTTEPNGFYELEVDAPYTGTVTAGKTYWGFTPTSRNYVSLSSDVNDQNFVGDYTAEPYPTITGYVKTAGGQPVKGVQIAADSLGGSAMTDANGFYELTLFGDALAIPRPYDGNVVPFKTDWSFSPPNNVYTGLAFDIQEQNYTASYIGAGCANGWTEQWVSRYNGDDLDNFVDQIQDMAVDNAGNIYVTGRSYNHLTKWDCAWIKYDPNGELLLEARYDHPTGENDSVEAIVIDRPGNVYVTGYTEANDIYGEHNNCTTLRYPPGSNTPDWIAVYDGPDHENDKGIDITTDSEGFIYVLCSSYGSSTSSDIVTIKYSPDSNVPVWTARYNGPTSRSDDPEAIVVDHIGNIYVTGSSYSTAERDDFVTIKYSPEGTQLWTKNYNGSANEWDYPKDITLDEFGNVYVTGNTEETSTGNITTIKYDTDGNKLWMAKFSAGVDGYVAAMVPDGYGNLYVAGGGGASANPDFLLIKYSTDSNQPLWISTYDGPDGLIDYAEDVTADRCGNIYLTGWSNFSGGYPATSADFMTVKYSPDSNQPLWSAVYSGPPGSMEGAQRVVVDDAGNVIVGGSNEAMVVVKYSQCCDSGDINCDRTVDYDDLGYVCDEWLMEKCYFDIAPDGGDGFVDFLDYSVLANSWLRETGQSGYNPVCDVSPQGGDGKIDQQDANVFMDEWLKAGWYYLDADIAPTDEQDGVVNFLDYAILCSQWLM